MARQVAELHISDLEQQVSALRKELVGETGRLAATREEQERLIDELRAENSQLRARVEEASLLLDIATIDSIPKCHYNVRLRWVVCSIRFLSDSLHHLRVITFLFPP